MEDAIRYSSDRIRSVHTQCTALLRVIEERAERIVQLSKEAGLPTWDKPAAACLASRFAYGEKITTEGLVRVANAEKFIRDLGFKGIRVRVHGGLARIEVAPEDMERFLGNADEVTGKLKSLGFTYVTMDLKGYRTGSMNEVLDE